MNYESQPNGMGYRLTMRLLLLVLVGSLARSAFAQNYAFNRIDYPVGQSPRALAVGDFNGDGKMDIVVADTNDPGDKLSILLGNSDGTFAAAAPITIGGQPTSVAVGDFNNDGKLDIVAVSGFLGSAGFSILLGNGDGTFQHYAFINAGMAPTSIAVGDFNGDKNLDVAISDNETTGNGVYILLGNGNGTFGTPKPYASAADPRMVVVADFNGDHKLDLATVNSASGNVSVLLGKGDGTFPTHAEYTTEAGAVSIAVGDLRHVGKMDLIVGGQSNGNVNVLLSNGNGTFQAVSTKYNVPGGVDIVAVGDFNGDGKLDVAVTNGATAGLVTILTGKGTGILNPAIPATAFGTANGPMGLASADFNGDGVADLVVVNNSSSFSGPPIGSVSVLLSNKKSMFAGRSDYSVSASGTSGAYAGIAAADFNGDGKQDLALGISPASTISVLLNSGTGTFKHFVEYPLPNGPLAVTTGDFKNNHHPDIAATTAGSFVEVLFNNGNGTFQTPASTFPIAANGNGIAVGDFNQDGILDIVATNEGISTVSVLLGTGNGGFQTFKTYPTGALPEGVVVGDFNHDGWPDIAVANQNAGTVSVLLNDKSGGFLPKQDYQVGGGPIALAVGSFRGNGLMDIAVATNSFSPGVVVLLNNGDGTFPTNGGVAYNTLNNARNITAGDFNNDGKLDLAVGINNGIFPGFVSILPGNGNGTFGTQLSFLTGTVPFGIVAADFNKDGGLDLAIADGTTQGGDIGAATVLLNLPVMV